MAERAGSQAVYAAADAPEAALPGFWERVVGRAEDATVSHGRAILLLDEAHLLAGWASHLKGVWDRFRRRRRLSTS
jgi:predicted AAA+ superfamily ATPase